MIYCIGDSHANFFSGFDEMQPEWPEKGIKHKYPFMKGIRIGPVLAYNLCKYNTTTKGREKLFELLRTEVPKGSPVMMCFGEIDCRAHIILQAEKQNRTTNDIAEEVVERYFSVFREIKVMGYQPAAWNVLPSAPDDVNSWIRVPHQYLFHGTCAERNMVTREFNAHLKRLAQEHDMFFLDFFDRFINEDKTVKTEYYFKDDIHLSQKAMPIVLERLKQGFSEIVI